MEGSSKKGKSSRTQGHDNSVVIVRGRRWVKVKEDMGEKLLMEPWLVWLNGLSAGLQTKGSQV